MIRSFILSVLAATLLLIACQKNLTHTNQSQTNQSQTDQLSYVSDTTLLLLAGQWRWIQQTRATTVFGNPDQIITANGLGITEYLNIDSSNWTWTLVRNGSTIVSGACKMASWDPPGPLGSTGGLSLDFIDNGKDSMVNHWLSTDNDTLYTTNMEINPTYNVDTYVRQVAIGIIK